MHNLNPVLLSLGPLEIRYYGLAWALGFLLAYYFMFQIAKQNKIENFDEQKAESLLMYIIIGSVVGARLAYFVFADPSIFYTRPLELVQVWHGGLSFHGGLLGIILAVYIFSKKYKVTFFQIADPLALISLIGLGFGRLANFINAELVGRVTNLPWCVEFPLFEGCRHPYQIYASISHFLAFIILFHIWKKQTKPGKTFFHFLWIYGLLRFITDFFRDDSLFTLGLTLGQVGSLLMILLSVYLLNKFK